MSGRIPQAFIDDLMDRLDIVDIVDSRVKLKRSGKNYSACCPFHDEKTPSFTVSPEKQFYYCFGCGASGNALGFVMDYERLSFRDAIESLAKIAGVTVPEETERSPAAEAAEKRRKQIYQVLEQTSVFFQSQLRRHPARAEAAGYLRKRGLSAEVVKEFNLGLAPPGWDGLLKYLAEQHPGLSPAQVFKLAQDAGLAIANPDNGRQYDRFRHRIMFPIQNTRGRVIGFGGRMLEQTAATKSQPKYLNSPETDVFHKGRELYGLWAAKQKLPKLERLLVVEGYMDVVALAQFGIHYAVATLGTACGEEHLNLAFKHTSEVVFCFDGDKAGRSAARRALENSLPAMSDGRAVKFLFLPEGEDPDTLVRQIGQERFETLVNGAIPLEEFLFDSVSTDLNINSMEGRAKMSKRAAPLINRLPPGVYRELMFGLLAKRTDLSAETIKELTALAPEPVPIVREPAAPSQPEAAAPAPRRHLRPAAETHKSLFRLTPEKRLSALLLQHPALAQQAVNWKSISATDNQDLERFRAIFELLQARPHYSINRILGYWRATRGAQETEELASLVAEDMLASAGDRVAYDANGEFAACLQQVSKRQQALRRQENLEKLQSSMVKELSREERRQLVEQILRDKLQGHGE
ncbi:DNA primase [Halioxenophilus sp. WMMB6]|uniref:DNA primase n=1 Tax=Halioxenophilus sp. WMMB6 TaxID=3073815 RepID=UPI00295EDEAA|nr:DNA primase [Halioxenophilus sp. WMMB6]